MATDDQQVRVTGTASAPTSFRIPGNGQIQPKVIFAHYDGSAAAGTFLPAIKVTSDGGETVGIFPVPNVAQMAAGVSADVTWFPDVGASETAAAAPQGITQETLYLDSKTSQSVTTSAALTSGVNYVAIVEGTFSAWNEVLNRGVPEADAMFPGSAVGRVSTQVGVDADTIFAWPSDHPHTAGHDPVLLTSLDGATFTHIEPVDGPFGVPQVGHLYRYELTGQGNTARFKINDTAFGDNYGKLKITIQVPNGTGTGSGAGALVPPTDTTLNGDVLEVVAGIPAWVAGGAGTVTNVSSADSSIVVTNPTTTPSLQLAALNTIATNEPPSAAWSNNGKKITSVADPTLAQDAATKAYVDAHAGTGTVTNVASGDSSIVVTNPTTTPSLQLAALSTIATNEPPSADWSNNSHKITSVTDPTSAQDAATKAYVDAHTGTGTGSTVNVYGAGVSSWSKPADTKVIEVVCIGSGGGGGGGGLNTGAAAASGGGGGGGGAVTRATFQASDVTSPVTVTVGAGGGGGGSAANGSNGAATTFGSLLVAGGGGGGGQGKQAAASGGGGGGSGVNTANLAVGGVPATTAPTGAIGSQSNTAVANTAPGPSEWGGTSGGSNGAGNNVGGAGGDSMFGGPGGGGGAGASTSTPNNGGAGGTTQAYATGGGGGGGQGGSNPVNGTPGSFVGPFCGSGGGGGGATTSGTNPGGTGGLGGIGAGGGGGGSGRAAANAGPGGAGGDGRCIVISY